MEIKQLLGLEIKSFFEQLSPSQLVDESLLCEFILKQVGVGFRGRDFAINDGEYLPKNKENRGYELRIWPQELAQLLVFLYQHKHEINSYLEFGTGRGGSFFVIDGYLRAINPNMGKSITVDQNDYLPKGFEEYKKHYPVEYVGEKTNKFCVDKSYDLCFIDANHSYSSTKRDYEKVKDYCKFIAFHDIATVNPQKPEQRCVRHFWAELPDPKIEFITNDPRVSFKSGIGIIKNLSNEH